MAKKTGAKHRDIGVEAKSPQQFCTDIKCPWHGTLPVRGRVFVGSVISDKAAKTVVVEWGFNRLIPKYERYERRHTRLVAYNPECISAKTGDSVKIAECRPLSKTKSFVVIEKMENGVKEK
jgi:small subunit ribosomal protein S17